MSVRHASDAVEVAFAGLPVSRIQQGQTSFDLAVRCDPAVRSNIGTLRATLMTTPAGGRVPLSALADIRNDRAPRLWG